jgi:nicotinamidase-related amidase
MIEFARRSVLALAVAAALGLASPAAFAQSIVDEWANVKTPPAPALKPVAIDAKTTALLMLDFMNQNCGKRPRCIASEPKVKKLLTEARAKGAAVVYSIIANTTTADVRKELAPTANEPWVRSGVDKFFRTDLEKILKDKGIQTVIVVGTAANGAVLYTASGSALRGMNVIVPIDGMSSVDTFSEQYSAWHLANAPVISPKVTLTKIDMVKF